MGNERISSEYIPTVDQLQNADLDRRFGAIISDADPECWWSVALCAPPSNAAAEIYWGCGFVGRDTTGYGDGAFADAILSSFSQVDYWARKGVTVGMTIFSPMSAKHDPNMTGIVVLPVGKAPWLWSALKATKTEGWQAIIERTSRESAVLEAYDFCEFSGFSGLITVYPPPIA